MIEIKQNIIGMLVNFIVRWAIVPQTTKTRTLIGGKDSGIPIRCKVKRLVESFSVIVLSIIRYGVPKTARNWENCSTLAAGIPREYVQCFFSTKQG